MLKYLAFAVLCVSSTLATQKYGSKAVVEWNRSLETTEPAKALIQSVANSDRWQLADGSTLRNEGIGVEIKRGWWTATVKEVGAKGDTITCFTEDDLRTFNKQFDVMAKCVTDRTSHVKLAKITEAMAAENKQNIDIQEKQLRDILRMKMALNIDVNAKEIMTTLGGPQSVQKWPEPVADAMRKAGLDPDKIKPAVDNK